MLESLTRIIADRSVGSLFFGNYHLMDFELMGWRRPRRNYRRNRQAWHDTVPAPVVPFGSKQWPTLVTPGPGPASLADLSITPVTALTKR